MTADEKNALLDSAKTLMNSAIALVIAEVFSGLVAAPALMLAAGDLIRQTGLEQEAVEAEHRAAECPAILLIPWPFIYIGSNAWIAAVARLRDGLPQFVELEPVARRKEGAARAREERAARSRAHWEKLSEEQCRVLSDAGLTRDMVSALRARG
jgi:hypothetical protein